MREFLKRLIDISLALFLLLLTAPVLICAAVLVAVTSPGPIFYCPLRVGRGGREFLMYKFRSMYAHPPSVDVWAKGDDDRITPLGRILRRFRIDELPQLLNVLKGNMSIIGPRPEAGHYVEILAKQFPAYRQRFNVLPGITGLAQVNAGYARTLAANRKKLEWDLYYVEHRSISMDILILLKTLPAVISGSGL